MQKYLKHRTIFWHKWPVHDLVLVIPPPPLIKVASNTRPNSKLGGTTLKGRGEGGQHYILQTCDQERFEARNIVFLWECLNIFVTGCSTFYNYGCVINKERGFFFTVEPCLEYYFTSEVTVDVCLPASKANKCTSGKPFYYVKKCLIHMSRHILQVGKK